jgi:multiple sugar transport system substrate-binding protein
MKKLLKGALVALLLSIPVLGWSQTQIVLWDFLSGGDGVRWKVIVDGFNASQSQYQVVGTTLTWGDPFYAKVHVGVVAGETPDVMTYHLSHFPVGIKGGDLRPITDAELKTVGLAIKDFNPALTKVSLDISKTFGKAGVLYGVPLDTHTSILYINKDLFKQAGLLAADGSIAPISGIEQFTAALQKLKALGVMPFTYSASGDPATVWRLFYTLYSQMGGGFVANGKISLGQLDTIGKKTLQLIADWTTQGLAPNNIAYADSIALFSSGKAAIMFNGNWEVPTMVDLKASNKLGFDYGLMAFPKLFGSQATWADSHNIAIPNNSKTPISAAKLKGVLTFIAYVEKNADKWAGGGHLPAYLPVLNGPVLKTLSPVNQYAAQAAKDVYLEPVNPAFGVGDPAYAAVDNFLTPAITGSASVADGIAGFKDAIQSAQ